MDEITVDEAAWTRQGYEASAKGRAWRFTMYEDGWQGCKQSGVDLEGCGEIKAIFLAEMSLGSVPSWALEIHDRLP